MFYERKVRKIGNSLGVLLPSDLLKYLDIKNGSTVNVSMESKKIVIEPKIKTSSED